MTTPSRRFQSAGTKRQPQSLATNSRAPSNADVGSNRRCDGPTTNRARCGTTRPMKAMPPVLHTVVAVSPHYAEEITTADSLGELTEDAMVQILTEPKNALVKQYQKLFAMDDVELEIRPSALLSIARKALARKTGARGLRSILELALIDTMFDLPTLNGVAKVVMDEHTIEEEAAPLLVYHEQAKASA